jgi:hypothetical protein
VYLNYKNKRRTDNIAAYYFAVFKTPGFVARELFMATEIKPVVMLFKHTFSRLELLYITNNVSAWNNIIFRVYGHLLLAEGL